MEENKNNTAAVAEATIDSIKKLMDAIGNDDELKQKQEDTLAALTGKTSAKEEQTSDQEKETSPENEAQPNEAEDDDYEDDDDDTSSGNDFSDIFNEDALAGMVLGFVAGAAVVGGGVLLHKLITND